jgi:hypothetical protein
MEAICFSKTYDDFLWNIQRYIPEGIILPCGSSTHIYFRSHFPVFTSPQYFAVIYHLKQLCDLVSEPG